MGRGDSYDDLKDVLLTALRVQPERWYLRVDLATYVERVGFNGREYASSVEKLVSTALGEIFGKSSSMRFVATDAHPELRAYERTGYGTAMTAYRYHGPAVYPDPATNLAPLTWGQLVGMRPQHWGDEYVARRPGVCLWPGCGESFQAGYDLLRVIQVSFPVAPTLHVHKRHAAEDVVIRRRGQLLPGQRGAVLWR